MRMLPKRTIGRDESILGFDQSLWTIISLSRLLGDCFLGVEQWKKEGLLASLLLVCISLRIIMMIPMNGTVEIILLLFATLFLPQNSRARESLEPRGSWRRPTRFLH